MIVTIVGTGLIGGSMAIALRQQGIARHLIGVDASPEHAVRAVERRLVDEHASLEDAVRRSDLVILAVPVLSITRLLPDLLDLTERQIIMDVGSTKAGILDAVAGHPRRGRFVATHPMWGTEYSGPDAAVTGAFTGKAAVICDRQDSDPDALERVEEIYRAMGMHLVYMNGRDHDVHVAYVSHISHITSFALANTVLEKEREEDAIFELASGGFESTVRLAKSNPATWASIFMQNRENVLDVLNEHITQLRKFKAFLEKENMNELCALMEQANKIKRIIR